MCTYAEAEHTFEGRENDWGFTNFTNVSDLLAPEKGFLINNALQIKAEIEVEHPDNYLYNSKKKTGFVGLKNQGATCYLNSLLQTLYNISVFRQVREICLTYKNAVTRIHLVRLQLYIYSPI